MEHWHPNPGFFFQPGAGPVFDVGVYYITALVNLLGGGQGRHGDGVERLRHARW